VASSFEHLRDFVQKRRRMSHIYQPIMISELLKSGGKASIRDIAAAFLSRDESQLEYYGQITKDMPGKVLGKHGIVELTVTNIALPLIHRRCLRMSGTS
jgi:ATP adenylyltransferase